MRRPSHRCRARVNVEESDTSLAGLIRVALAVSRPRQARTPDGHPSAALLFRRLRVRPGATSQRPMVRRQPFATLPEGCT